MLRYQLPSLGAVTLAYLHSLQQRVDAESTREKQIERATSLFRSKTAAAWDDIKRVLSAHSPQGEACYYCERDRYRDIEHIRPKRHFPEQCFLWENYVYACTICNQDRKKDKFGFVADDGDIEVIDRTYPADQALPGGQHALINIRAEDPLSFIRLDLETGVLLPENGDAVLRARAIFTIDLFDLNDDALCRFRRQAARSFLAYLKDYQTSVANGDAEAGIRILAEIDELPFPTVLIEMRRQAQVLPELSTVFQDVPEEVGQRP